MIIKTVINLVEIIIIAQVLYKIGRFFLTKKKYGKNKKGKSIIGKVAYLISNNMHYCLDNRIKAQIKRNADERQQSSNKVIEIKKYKRV